MLGEETERILQEYADEIIRLAQENLADPNRPRKSTLTGKVYRKRIDNTGDLSNSLQSNIKVGPNSIQMSISANEYADVVDGGRRIGKGIPIEPLKQWIRTKPITLRGKDGRFIERSEKNIESLAKFISWKASKFGIGPTNFLRDAVEEATKEYEGKLPTAMLNDVARATVFIIRNLQEQGRLLRDIKL